MYLLLKRSQNGEIGYAARPQIEGIGGGIEAGGAGVGFVGGDEVEGVGPRDFGLVIEEFHGGDVVEGEVGGEVLVDEVDVAGVFEVEVDDG